MYTFLTWILDFINKKIMQNSVIVKFASVLVKYILKYVLFVLPFVLIFKGLYLCWSHDIMTFEFFSQEFISNIPFLGVKLSKILWGENLILTLENIQNNQKIIQLIFMGGLGSCLGKTLFDVWFSNCDYFKLPAVTGPSNIRSGKIPEIKIPLILQSTQDDSNLNLGSSNVPSVQGPVNDINWTSIWQIPLKTFIEEISPCFEQYTRILQDMNSKSLSYTLEVPRDNEDPSITEASLIKSLLSVLQTHSKMIQGSFAGREGLVSELRHLLSEEDQRRIEELSTRKDKVLDDYLENISSLQGSLVKGLLKRFSDATNGYGREMTKLAREQDDIIRRGLKGHPVNRKPEFKKMIRTDYPEVLKSFQKEDDALRKRFSLLFNQPKKN
jgi:hypothetical protein